MAEFTMAIAGHSFAVRSLFDSTRDYCARYLTGDTPEFCLAVFREELAAMQEVLRQEIADTDGTHGPFIIEPFECLPAFRYQRLPICAGEGQGPMNEEQIQILHLQILEGGFKACHGFIIA